MKPFTVCNEKLIEKKSLVIFNMVWPLMTFPRDSFCLSAVSLSRQWHDILDFSYCPLSRVLHVTLANPQKFGFEFHLRSSPSAFSGYEWAVDKLIISFNTCYTVLTKLNKVETAVHGCNSWLSVWTLSCCCSVKRSTLTE